MKKKIRKTIGTKKTSSKLLPGFQFRSEFELRVALWFNRLGLPFTYEQNVIPYLKGKQKRNYIPDFFLPEQNLFIETKGYWDSADRIKHLLVNSQHPNLDIRLVFMNPKAKINKRSKTTYASYCERYGLKYSGKNIPKKWLLP